MTAIADSRLSVKRGFPKYGWSSGADTRPRGSRLAFLVCVALAMWGGVAPGCWGTRHGELAAADATSPTVRLWPQAAPGDAGELGPEADLSKPQEGLVAGKTVIRLGNVADPTLTVFRPQEGQGNGSAVLVCPGGGYHILAWDLEGTEVCEWLNSIGVTGVLLKYRVPRRPNLEKSEAPLQDAQRAMGLVRQHASEWGIEPDRIGVLGFSAGGHLAARLSTNYAQRTYERVDAADDLSCRPDFTLLIYPAYLTQSAEKKPNEVSEQERNSLATNLPIDKQTPPAFITMAANDPVNADNALLWALGLKRAEVPVELHLYPTGGHGYGLRRTESLATAWPDRATEWLKGNGWLQPASAAP